MTLFNNDKFKRIFSFVLIFVVAVITGFSVGKIYIDSTVVEGSNINETEKQLREDESVIISLYNQAMGGASATSFSAVQLYQIAEYKLHNSTLYLKETLGKVNSTGVDVITRTQKIRNGNHQFFYKLSPSVPVLGIATPSICTKVQYDYANPNKINVYSEGSNAFTNTDASETLDANFSSKPTLYTEAEYEKKYYTTPKTSVLPYIISSKTCTTSQISAVKDNGNGTFSCDFVLTGQDLKRASKYYTQEILLTCGYRTPALQWDYVNMTITVDSNFNFAAIKYEEKYVIASPDIPVLKKATVIDYFDDTFYFDEQSITGRAMSDYAKSMGVN